MAPGKLSISRDSLLIVTGADHAHIYDNKNTFPRISDPAWATYPNPTMTPDSTTVHDHMMKAAGILDNTLSINADIIAYIIAGLPSPSIVDDLGQRNSGMSFSDTIKGNTDDPDLVSKYSFGHNLDYGWGLRRMVPVSSAFDRLRNVRLWQRLQYQ